MDQDSIVIPTSVCVNGCAFTHIVITGHFQLEHSPKYPIDVAKYITQTLDGQSHPGESNGRICVVSNTTGLPDNLTSGFEKPYRKTVCELRPENNRIIFVTQYPLGEKRFDKAPSYMKERN